MGVGVFSDEIKMPDSVCDENDVLCVIGVSVYAHKKQSHCLGIRFGNNVDMKNINDSGSENSLYHLLYLQIVLQFLPKVV